MGIVVDLGKIKMKEILHEAYKFAEEQTNAFVFGNDTPDDYPRGIQLTCLTKKDKIDWAILEQLASELDWFLAERKYFVFGIKSPYEDKRHDKLIFFQSRVAMKLNECGLACYNDVSYHD